MPRDGSGVYTLPAGNPVVTNTVIASVWANGTMSDIAVQLNNVFTRDGLLGPTGPFKVVDGTVAAPGLAWNSEPGLGWYREGANRLSLAAAGRKILGIDATTPGTLVVGSGAETLRMDALLSPLGSVPVVATNCLLGLAASNAVGLFPRNGVQLWIEKRNRPIPLAGIVKTNPATLGLAANAQYNVYAFWTGTAVDIEFGPFATPVTDAFSGIQTKPGDVTRTYVGSVLTAVDNTFQDNPTQNLIGSMYNRRRKKLVTTSTIAFPKADGIMSHVNTTSPLTAINMGDDSLGMWAIGSVQGSDGNSIAIMTFGRDGTAPGNAISANWVWQGYTATANGGLALNYSDLPARGAHSYYLLGQNSGPGSVSFQGGLQMGVDVWN